MCIVIMSWASKRFEKSHFFENRRNNNNGIKIIILSSNREIDVNLRFATEEQSMRIILKSIISPSM